MSVPATVDRRDVAIGWRLLDGVIAARGALLPRRFPRRLSAFLQLLPSLVLVCVLLAGVCVMVWRSFHAFDSFLYEEGGLSLGQYRQLLESGFTVSVFARTIGMALVTTPVALALALPIAYVTVRTRSNFLRLLLITAIFFPFLTGDVVRGYGWLAILGPHGPLAWLMDGLGLGEPHVLGTPWGVGIGVVQLVLPIAVMILIPSFARLDPDVERAAGTLGARPWRVFWSVIVPQLKVGLIGAAVVAMTLSLTDFADPALLGGGKSDYVANQIQAVVLGLNNPYKGSALAVMLVLVVLAMVALLLAAIWLVGRAIGHVRRRQRVAP